jgi:transposase
MTYPIQFRKKVLRVKEKEKLSFVEVAEKFHLSKTTVFKWSKEIKALGKRNKKAKKIDMEALKKDIEKYPDSYCYERANRLNASRTGIRDAQYRLGVTYKKNPKSPKGMCREKIYVLPKDRRT